MHSQLLGFITGDSDGYFGHRGDCCAIKKAGSGDCRYLLDRLTLVVLSYSLDPMLRLERLVEGCFVLCKARESSYHS